MMGIVSSSDLLTSAAASVTGATTTAAVDTATKLKKAVEDNLDRWRRRQRRSVRLAKLLLLTSRWGALAGLTTHLPHGRTLCSAAGMPYYYL